MNYQIDKTAEQFANDVQKQRILFSDVDDRNIHIDKVIEDNWPGMDRDSVFVTLTLNTVNQKLDAMDRDSTRDPNRWIETRQMSLFNEPAFKLPKFMFIGNKKKHYREVSLVDGREILDGFLKQTRKEADELAKAWEQKENKAEMIKEQLQRADRLIDMAGIHGYNPKDLTFGDVENAPFENESRQTPEAGQDAIR